MIITEKGRQMDKKIAAVRQALCVTKIIKEDNVPCKIEEGLYLGSLGAANDKPRLKSLNITHILTVANGLAPAHPNDFTYKVISVPDREHVEISQYFDECFNFIEEGKRVGGVLVHCYKGRSRSVTAVVSYLMKKHGTGMSEVLELVKSKRPLACPNAGFMLQLQNYEKFLRGTSKMAPRRKIALIRREGGHLPISNKQKVAPVSPLEASLSEPVCRTTRCLNDKVVVSSEGPLVEVPSCPQPAPSPPLQSSSFLEDTSKMASCQDTIWKWTELDQPHPPKKQKTAFGEDATSRAPQLTTTDPKTLHQKEKAAAKESGLSLQGGRVLTHTSSSAEVVNTIRLGSDIVLKGNVQARELCQSLIDPRDLEYARSVRTQDLADGFFRAQVEAMIKGSLLIDCYEHDFSIVSDEVTSLRAKVIDLEKQLMAESIAHRKEMKELAQAHDKAVSELKEKHATELTGAVERYKGSEDFKADLKAHVQANEEEIVNDWLATKPWLKKLVERNMLLYNLGRFYMQQKIYTILRQRDPTFSPLEWGLPAEMVNPLIEEKRKKAQEEEVMKRIKAWVEPALAPSGSAR